ncbi:hypothetical protein [Actinomyces sp.]|uniref:hypothetical protein n=1 Tax=Actinomyces sp. TaxID=29317 RepID=UPI0026DCCBFA|nr:hypothetical protein [Actinomyces sp.]MDO4899429.1 hypothetical protein [Actinomyces sp.]
MDTMRSSLETPPPAWGRYDGPISRSHRREPAGRDGMLAVWALVTCVLVGVLLIVAITPSLYTAAGLALSLSALAGWGVLSARLVRELR